MRAISIVQRNTRPGKERAAIKKVCTPCTAGIAPSSPFPTPFTSRLLEIQKSVGPRNVGTKREVDAEGARTSGAEIKDRKREETRSVACSNLNKRLPHGLSTAVEELAILLPCLASLYHSRFQSCLLLHSFCFYTFSG